ncbi:hypothetical protein EP7_001874 [Isosphaeraceae bacterium EP7]
MVTIRSAQELENRRRLAVARVNDGHAQIEVARFLGDNVRSIRRWVAIHRQQGKAGLSTSTPPDQTPKFTPEQGLVVLE